MRLPRPFSVPTNARWPCSLSRRFIQVYNLIIAPTHGRLLPEILYSFLDTGRAYMFIGSETTYLMFVSLSQPHTASVLEQDDMIT